MYQSDSDNFIWIAVFAILAAIVNSLGIFILFKFKSWAEKAKTYFMCFAAGVLISTPLMLALPQAIQKNFYAGTFALLGFLLCFFQTNLLSA